MPGAARVQVLLFCDNCMTPHVLFLTVSFAGGSFSRGGLYCVHQVSCRCVLLQGSTPPAESSIYVMVQAGWAAIHDLISACMQDINPKYAGALLGISNTAGALPGIIGVSAVGVLLDRTGSWASALFIPIAATYLLGLLTFSWLGSSERIDFDRDI